MVAQQRVCTNAPELYIFLWPCHVACGVLFSSPTRVRTHAPYIGSVEF